MTLIPVVVMVEVPDKVVDARNCAEFAVHMALTGQLASVTNGKTWGVDVLLRNDTTAFCGFHVSEELNTMIKSGNLLFMVPSGRFAVADRGET